MNFELADKLEVLLETKQLDEAIALAEFELREMLVTDFHEILGRNILHMTINLRNYIKAFDKSTKSVLIKKQGFFRNFFVSKKEMKPAAYYAEMNGFTINCDRWYIDLFSFENYTLTDWDWLSDFYDYSQDQLTVTGLEDIQKVFKDFHENQRYKEPILYQAFEVCELLVVLRLQELFKEAYKEAYDDWSSIPMFVTAHDYDLFYKANDK